MAKDMIGSVIGKVIDGVLNSSVIKNVKKYVDSEDGKKTAEKLKGLFTMPESKKPDGDKEEEIVEDDTV